MPLPDAVIATLSGFLAEADGLAPDLVEGLLVHGALGYGEFFAGRSDVDAVVLLSRRAGAGDLAALEEAHRGPGGSASSRPADADTADHLLHTQPRPAAARCTGNA